MEIHPSDHFFKDADLALASEQEAYGSFTLNSHMYLNYPNTAYFIHTSAFSCSVTISSLPRTILDLEGADFPICRFACGGFLISETDFVSIVYTAFPS